MNLFKLFGEIAVNNKDANKSLDETTKKAKDSEGGMTKAFKAIGTAVATYFAVDKIKAFGSECVEMASNVQEMQNKFDVVFSGMTDDIEDWASTYSKSIGRNSNTIKGYLADNQNMFVGMGMTRDQGAKLSEQLVEMALDLASFNNLNETDAVNAMSKAIMGQTESAKQLGAVLNENTRKMAMEQLGYKGKFEALTEAQKMEVNYQAIVNQSADAIGDCARSLDSYKGRQIQATSAVENLKEKIGGYLIPVMTKLQEKIGTVANWFSDHLDPAVTWVQDKFEKLRGKFEYLASYAQYTFQPVMDKVHELFDKIREKLQPVIDAVVNAKNSFVEWTTSGEANKDIMNILKDVIDALADAIGWVVDKAIAFTDWASEHQGLMETLGIIIGSIATAWLLVNGAIEVWNVIGVIATAVTTGFGSAVAFLTSPITIAVAIIGALIAIGVLLYKNWDTIKQKAIDLANKVKETFSNLKNAVVEKFESIKQGITDKINSARDKVKEAIEKIKSFFKFEWSLPKLKMPHFSISGKFSLNPPSIPKIGVDWYAKAMNNAMLLNDATIFGAQNGKLLGGGEAGSEVVAGASTLMKMVKSAVASEMASYSDSIDRIVNTLDKYLPSIPDIAKMQVVMNSGAVVGELMPQINYQFGNMNRMKGRGLTG